jgi:hypothetical protein
VDRLNVEHNQPGHRHLAENSADGEYRPDPATLIVEIAEELMAAAGELAAAASPADE